MRRMLKFLRRTPLHPQWLLSSERAATAEIRKLKAGRVLDIGCADRWVERILAESCEYIGLDYPNTGKLMYGASPDIFADAACIPLPDSSVDAVVILEVVEHLRQPREAIDEIGRVLRPKGRLLLSMPFLYPIHDAPHDYQRYTVHGLTRDIEAAGLCIDRIEPSLGSSETAGIIGNLALAGIAIEALQRRSPAILVLPLIALAIPLINVSAWVCGRFLSSWSAITVGYSVMASKP